MENIIWTVSIIPLILGTVIRMFVGAFWYSPTFFGKPWMRMLDIKMEDMQTEKFKQVAKRNYIASAVVALVISYIVGLVIGTLGLGSLGALMMTALLLLGFVFPISLNPHLWEDQPWGLLPIRFGYEVVTYLIIALLHVYL